MQGKNLYKSETYYFGDCELDARRRELRVENATGEAELDWASTGFMALINRILEDRSIEVVSGDSVSGVARSTERSGRIYDRSAQQLPLRRAVKIAFRRIKSIDADLFANQTPRNIIGRRMNTTPDS